MVKRLLRISVILLLLTACSDTNETPQSTPEVVIKEIVVTTTPEPTLTSEPTWRSVPTVVPTFTAKPTSISQPTASQNPTFTPTPMPTQTITPAAVIKEIVITATPEPTLTPEPTWRAVATVVPTLIAKPSSISQPTKSQKPTFTATPIPTQTFTPAATNTSIPSTTRIIENTGVSTKSKQNKDVNSTNLIYEITVDNNKNETESYNRKNWKHWVDYDNDCQDTRTEVLIEESKVPVEFKDVKQCKVESGLWLDLFTGTKYTDPTKLDIDHMVPLNNVHFSGGSSWSNQKKESYANSLDNTNHLIAVSASANRSKGAKGPEDWRPTNKEYWCDYAIDWLDIKIKWDLTVNEKELAAIADMVKYCEIIPVITFINKTLINQEIEPKLESPSSSDDNYIGKIIISYIQCTTNPEMVSIKNSTDAYIDLGDWKIEDHGAKHSYLFPTNTIILPNSEIRLFAGKYELTSDDQLLWTKRTVLNNDGDLVRLFDSNMNMIAEESCK